jgi:hypothetical protein
MPGLRVVLLDRRTYGLVPYEIIKTPEDSCSWAELKGTPAQGFQQTNSFKLRAPNDAQGPILFTDNLESRLKVR